MPVSAWPSVRTGMLALCAAAPALPQAPVAARGSASEALSAAEIVERALARAAEREESELDLRFESSVLSTVETIGADGEATDVKTARYRRYPLEGSLYQEIVERDGKALDASEARRERQRKQDFIREARRRAAKGAKREPDRRTVRFNRELMDRYRTALAGTEELQGHRCWVIRAEPRDGPLPNIRRMDRALNQSTGRFWIAQDGYDMVRVSFEMRKPVRYLWGLFATLRQADGEIEYAIVEPGVWMPARFRLDLDLRLFLSAKAIRRRIRNVWSDYRLVPGGIEALPSSD